jgi:DEAD/DEAH box helicase domain-containing protein
MFALLRRAGLVVGFNSLRFDYAVLQPFADFDLRDLPSLDMLEEIKRRLNYRVSLDNLGQTTLGIGKTADGLQALQWWKEGRLDEIAAYCRRDVDVTLRLYEYGRREGHLLFTNKAGQKVRVPLEW